MVDPRGIEPLSEDEVTAASPGASFDLNLVRNSSQRQDQSWTRPLKFSRSPGQGFEEKSGLMMPESKGADNLWSDSSLN